VISGVAALVAAILFRRWLGAEVSLLQSIGVLNLGAQPQPTEIADWYKLLREHQLVGLALLNGLDLINYALVGLMIIGIHGALRPVNRVFMTLASALAAMGIAAYFASHQAFTLLSLSQQYGSATTDVQRAALVSAGQGLLTMNDPAIFGTGPFWGFILVNASCLIISLLMLRSPIFTRATAVIGILANALGLGHFFTAAFYPALTAIPLSASAPFLLIWYVLIGIRLLRLSRGAKTPVDGTHMEGDGR
jgi:hypothetical protein